MPRVIRLGSPLEVYLRHRAEYLKAEIRFWENGSWKERTCQARLHEVLALLGMIKTGTVEQPKTDEIS